MNNQPVSILNVVFNRSWGGLEMQVGKFTRYFDGNGFRAYAMHPGNDRLQEYLNRYDLTGFIVRPRLKYGDILAARKIAEIVRNNGIPIIQSYRSQDLSTLVLAKKLAGNVKLLHCQRMSSSYRKNSFLHKFIYGNVDKITALTRELKSYLVNLTPATEEKVVVIPNGVDLQLYDTARGDLEKTKKSLGIPSGGIIIGIVGRIDRKKGQDTVIKAAPKVLAKYPEAVFVFVGEPTLHEGDEYFEYLKRLVNELGLGGRVIFTGFCDNPYAVYRAFDISIVPSHKETFGNVTIESMAAGIPVISTNTGGTPEIIDHNKNGILVSPKDPDALAESLVSLLDSPVTMQQMGAAARKKVEDVFNYDIVMDQYRRIYYELASQ